MYSCLNIKYNTHILYDLIINNKILQQYCIKYIDTYNG